jgi:curved DNA-binding protein CbpA
MDQNLKNYYEYLELKPDASEEDIRKAYIRLARLYHPDHNPNPNDRRMIELNHVYETLSNAVKKKEYDKRFKPESSYDFTKPSNSPSVSDNKVYAVKTTGRTFRKKIEYAATIILVTILCFLFIYLLVKIIGVFITLPHWLHFIVPG